MTQNVFQMYPQKRGRIKYLLITLYLPLLLLLIVSQLTKHGVLPKTPIFIYVFLSLIIVLGYFFIFKKNHHIEVQDNTIAETDWTQKNTQKIKAVQIHSFRRNFLGEIILLDDSGHKLLCIESNMSNFDLFQQWLEQHNIQKNHGEKQNDKPYF